ncbi:fatty acid-binding protein 9-like [Saccopteryx leptura]|uniref:fatty acid-binding protein 9-like n=1 Tax=Saccopteryx leptura TaxID=249018 RepID=UPI00339C24BA
MVETFLGTWELEHSENFEEYLGQLVVSPSLDHAVWPLAILAKPIIWISTHEGKVNIKTERSFKNFEISFKLGEEFDETTMDNRKVKTIITLDGDSLVHVQKWLGEETTIKRQIVNGKMVVKHTRNNTVST